MKPAEHADHAELMWLRNEVESLQRQLAAAHAAAVAPPPVQPLTIPENVRRDPVAVAGANGSKPAPRAGRKAGV